VKTPATLACSLALGTLLLACREAPVASLAPGLSPATTARAAGAATAGCDISWMLGVDGDWSDSTNWAPSRPPTGSDRVCFTANGIYTVTLSSHDTVETLMIDDNSGVTLDAGSTYTITTDSLLVKGLGRLTMVGCADLSSGFSDVIGTFEATPSTACGSSIFVGTLAGSGLVTLQDATLSSIAFMNGGELRLTGTSMINFGTGVGVVSAGTITGTGTLLLTTVDTLIWNGEQLPARDAVTHRARVRVDAGRFLLPTGGSGVSGAIDVVGGATAQSAHFVTGDVPAGVDLGLATSGYYVLEHQAPSVTTRYTVKGQLTLAPSNGPLTVEVDTLVVANRLMTALQASVLDTYRFENRGRADLAAPLHLAATWLQSVPAFSSHENRGTIATTGSGQLEIGTFAYFALNPAARFTGRLVLDDGELTGDGTLDVVESRGGRIAPGTGWGGIGTITMTSLHLSQSSDVSLEVGGAANGASDRVRLTGTAQLGGTLDVRNVNGFAGGRCGDVVPVITGTTAGFASGHFTQYLGMQLAADREWRLASASTAQSLVGFDPRVDLSVAPDSLPLAEGGAAGAVSACLGRLAPTADVNVTITPRAREVTTTPSLLTFTPSNWALPQPLTVQAIDDARAEGPHVDSVRFVLASADPRYTGVARQELAVPLTDNDPAVDLSLSLVTIDSIASVNEQLDARFRITNAGPGASRGSTFNVRPMAGLAFVSSSAGVTCTATATALTCTVGALAAGANTEFVLLFRATSAGVHSNTGRVNGRDHDPNTVDNDLVWRVTIS
jgi:hypothetical protein